jgi:hypothetical protein
MLPQLKPLVLTIAQLCGYGADQCFVQTNAVFCLHNGTSILYLALALAARTAKEVTCLCISFAHLAK